MNKYRILQYLILTVLFLTKCTPTPFLWKDGRIPYCYADSFTVAEKMLIEDAMSDWERSNVIKFYEESCDIGVAHIVKGNSNFSSFGSQSLSIITLYNINYRTAAHELGHTIGLMHEHQRPDRDSYIYIHSENVLSNKVDQFYKLNKSYFYYDYKKYTYDYKSIMHYHSHAFSANGQETIESPEPIDNNNVITETDYRKVEYMYNPQNLAD